MKLIAAVVVGLFVCAIAGAKEEETKGTAEESGTDRRGRLFFLTKLLLGPAALAGAGVTSLGQTITSLSSTLGNLNLNQTSDGRQCPLPLFTSGCSEGFVCAMVNHGETRCVPQSPDGSDCTTGFQCISGVCRQDACVKDKCHTAGETSDCPHGRQCVATTKGNRCLANVNECPTPLSMDGCGENEYCTSSDKGNICKLKRQLEETCTDSVQCLSNICRSGTCKADACPEINMSIDCMTTQYCAPGANGNVCREKLSNGALCSASGQCMSNTCERGRCVQDDCPHPYQPGRCLPTQFCSPAPNGNMCMEKADAGASCRFNIECTSHTCRSNRCVVNQCPTPFSSDGCDMTMQFCMSSNTGNRCVTKLANGATCMMPAQCMSNNCLNSRCAANVPVLKPNGAACANPTECSSGNCVLSVCAASKMSVGGLCLAATDCQSLICTNMRCVAETTTAATTTAAAETTTSTTAATTSATTTAALLANGAMCAMASQCMSGRCFNMVCTAQLLTNGQACLVATDCRSNNCAAMVCALGAGAPGAVCTDGLQCATAVCAAGVCV